MARDVQPARPRNCRTCGLSEPDVHFLPRPRWRCVDCIIERRRSPIPKSRSVHEVLERRRARRVKTDRSSDAPEHLSYVRDLACVISNASCVSARCHAHHVRNGTGGGTAKKPSDRWAVPLCAFHHAEIHQVGWRTFEVRYGVDLRETAEHIAARSPHLKAERADDGTGI
jgi:hypothetical protein